jgi:hypothetical protein
VHDHDRHLLADLRQCRFSEGRDPFGLSCSEVWDPGT